MIASHVWQARQASRLIGPVSPKSNQKFMFRTGLTNRRKDLVSPERHLLSRYICITQFLVLRIFIQILDIRKKNEQTSFLNVSCSCGCFPDLGCMIKDSCLWNDKGGIKGTVLFIGILEAKLNRENTDLKILFHAKGLWKGWTLPCLSFRCSAVPFVAAGRGRWPKSNKQNQAIIKQKQPRDKPQQQQKKTKTAKQQWKWWQKLLQ